MVFLNQANHFLIQPKLKNKTNMNKKLLIRKSHRYIGLIVSLQLLAWTLGGIWFTWNDIDKIHGDHLRNTKTSAVLAPKVSVQKALEVLTNYKSLHSITVIQVLSTPVYRIKYTTVQDVSKIVLIDGNSGELFPEMTQQQAIDIVNKAKSFEAKISSVELITQTDAHHEYRENPMPAWAITYDFPESPTFYVSVELAKVTAVRHNSWRVFDFLWMLHTMDYQTRDDFGNWLIKIFSLIALVTAISGIVLFVISSRRRQRR